MAQTLKNIVVFTGLVVGVPQSLPHGLIVPGLGAVVPNVCSPNGGGYTITADDTNVTVTRDSADASADVNVLCEWWHSIERAFPQPSGIASSLFPFVVGGGGGGGGGGGLTALSGGTTLATGPVISFANGNNVTFGIVGNTMTASVQTAGGTATGVGISAGTESAGTGAVVFSNANNISFGMNASTVTASFSASIQPNPAISAAGASASNGTIIFSNGNGVSFGMAGSTVTASVAASSETPFAISAGTQSASTGTLVFSASNGLAFGMSGNSRVTGSYSTLSFDNGGNVTFGIAGSTITASAPGGGTGNIGIAAGTQTANTGTVLFGDSAGVFFGMSASTRVTGRIASVLGTNGENVTMRASGAPLLVENVNSNLSLLAGGAAIFSAGGANTILANGALSMSANNSVVLRAGANINGTANVDLNLSAANNALVVGGNASVIAGTGAVLIGTTGNSLGFYGVAPVARQTVTGTNATALNNALAALHNAGIISNAATVSAFGGTGNFGGISAAGGVITSGTASFVDAGGMFWSRNGQSLSLARVATVSATGVETAQVRASLAVLVSASIGNASLVAGNEVHLSGPDVIANGTNFDFRANSGVTLSGSNLSIQAGNTAVLSAAGQLSLRGGPVSIIGNTANLSGTAANVLGGNVSVLGASTVFVSASNVLELDAVSQVGIFANTVSLLQNAGGALILGGTGRSLGFYSSNGAVQQTITGASTALSGPVGSALLQLIQKLASYNIISNGLT